MLPLAGGVGIGYAIGYFLRKVIKLALLITGAFFGGVMYMQSQGFMSVNWDKIATATQGTMGRLAQSDITGNLQTAIGNIGIPLSSGMLVGMFFGFRKG